MTPHASPEAAARRAATELARIARFLTETLDSETVGARVVSSVRELFDVPGAGLRLREPDGTLVLVASAGGGGLYWPIGHRADPTFGFYPYVVGAGRPLRIPDLLDERGVTLGGEVRARIRASDVRSLLAVPLRVQERVTGVLSIAAEAGRAFGDDDVTLLEAFADQAALALENARSHAAALERRRESEALARIAALVNETLDPSVVGARIAEGVLDLLGVHSSAIRLVEPDGTLVAIALGGRATSYAGTPSRLSRGLGLAGRVAEMGEALWTSDVRSDGRFTSTPELEARNAATGTIAGLAVPLRVSGTVIGVLSVGHSARRIFAPTEVALLQAFADQAATALNNATTQQALARQAERLHILHEIDRALITEQAPIAIAEAVVSRLRTLLGVPRVIVNLFDHETGQVEWLAAAGRRRTHAGNSVRYPLAFAGDLEGLRRGEPQIVHVGTLPSGAEVDGLLASGITTYIVVPMLAGGDLIGSVSLGDTLASFPPELVAIAQDVATQLAIVMTQARLHERVSRQAADLEARVEERTSALSAATAEASRANQAKSEFLSRMSHELRTPLNAILGFAHLLRMDALPADQAESVDHILRAGRHLLSLINEVLEISRIEARRLQLSLEPVDVEETLRHAIELVRPTAAQMRVHLRLHVPSEHVHVLADRQRLQQVLLNLLSNAVKYNRADGSVTVSCSPHSDARLAIHVADTAGGIPADKQARLFTPFDRLGAETTGVEGTGLGLALSKHLVDVMGGTIELESAVGTGSRFTVILPLAAEPNASSESSTAPDADAAHIPTPQPITVVYIEDNPSNLRLVERIFERRPNVTLVSAIQGRVGIDLVRHHKPGLVLLDRHLPDVSGDEVLRLLAEDPATSEIPVVILSADASPAQIQRLRDAGARAYLTKPLDVEQLFRVLDEVSAAR